MAKKNIGIKTEMPKITVSKTKEKGRKAAKARAHKGKAPKVFIALLSVFILILIAGLVYQYWGRIMPGKSGDVAATVNGEKITVEELNDYYARLAPQTQAAVTKTQLLDDMINKKLLVKQANDEGITVSQSEVDDYLNGFLLQANISKEELVLRLSVQNISLEVLNNDIIQQLTITKLYQKDIIDKVNITDSEIEDYYNVNLDLFKTPEQVRAEHILICHNESLRCSSNLTPEDALMKIKEIRAMLNSSSFETLAQEYSEDPSSANSGDLGYFEKGVMVKPFEDAAFSLGIGEVSGVIETQYGFHLLKILDIKQASVQKLEDVKNEIGQALIVQKQQDELKKYLDDLKAKSKVQIFYNESLVKTN